MTNNSNKFPSKIQRHLIAAVFFSVAVVATITTVIQLAILTNSLSTELREKAVLIAETFELSIWYSLKQNDKSFVQYQADTLKRRYSDIVKVDVVKMISSDPPVFEMAATTAQEKQELMKDDLDIEAALENTYITFIEVINRSTKRDIAEFDRSNIYLTDIFNALLNPDHEYIWEVILPAHDDDDVVIGSFSIEVSFDDLLQHIKHSLNQAAIILLASLLFVGILLWFLGKKLLGTPLSRLNDGINLAKSGDLTQTIPTSRNDEIGCLASSYNEMIESLNDSRRKIEDLNTSLQLRVDQATQDLKCRNEELSNKIDELRITQHRLINSERYTASALMAAGIAHEIRSPLHILQQIGQIIHNEFISDSTRNNERYLIHFDEFRAQIKSLEKLTTQFLNYTRPVKLHLKPTAITEALTEVVDSTSDLAKKNKITFDLSLCADPPLIQADRYLLVTAFSNIIVNAIEAMPSGGVLQVSCSYDSNVKEFTITIKDNGMGINDGQLDEVFDPFFTKRPSGIGLGLPIAQRAIEAHEGEISLKSDIGEGACFTIALPAITSTDQIHA